MKKDELMRRLRSRNAFERLSKRSFFCRQERQLCWKQKRRGAELENNCASNDKSYPEIGTLWIELVIINRLMSHSALWHKDLELRQKCSLSTDEARVLCLRTRM